MIRDDLDSDARRTRWTERPDRPLDRTQHGKPSLQDQEESQVGILAVGINSNRLVPVFRQRPVELQAICIRRWC